MLDTINYELEKFLKSTDSTTSFAANTLHNVRVISYDIAKTSVVFTIPVDQTLVNQLGSVHGGFYAFAADVLTSFAVGVVGGADSGFGGVSVGLDMRYMGGSTPGDTLEARVRVEKAAGSVVFTSVDFVSRASGRIVACGTHTKYAGKKPSKL